VLLIHSSNLRPLKRIDLLLESVSKIRDRNSFKLLILAGGDFKQFSDDVKRLGLEERIIVRENVLEIEEYLQAADLALYTSESESFCLSILEAMFFGCPSVATNVGGIPEVVEDGLTGLLVPSGDSESIARALNELIADGDRRKRLGENARVEANKRFSSDAIIHRYEELYRRLIDEPPKVSAGEIAGEIVEGCR